jgi:hypothetical protein
MQKSKEATARIAIYRETKITNIFTMEASFSGSDHGKKKGKHFTTECLKDSGKYLLQAILVYSNINVQECLAAARLKTTENVTGSISQSSTSRKGSEQS